ncbi:MAG: undecaprenyldiphospho-muramoylpentapeptide beta-N-acetylglucosaminyltransferase [Gammaproteobacteria bacterium]
MSSRPVLVMAGGTGGHVFPGLAVARALVEQGVPVTWLGSTNGLEAKLVPPTGIPIEFVSIGGLRGKGLLTKVVAPFRLLFALLQSLVIMIRLWPRAVLGLGGFVTGPAGLAAWLARRPLVIHEQNAVAGYTNRILSRLANEVLEAFPGGFPEEAGARAVGNPVRREISELPGPEERMAGRTGPLRLLVFGGSQGSLCLNKVVPAALALIPESVRPQVRHQAGPHTLDVAQSAYADAGVEGLVTPFIDNMAEAYAWADLAVCRSGALTVSELAAAGLGSILVPFPAAVDDHQTLNAKFLVDANAAHLVQEADLDADRLAALLTGVIEKDGRAQAMAQAARELAQPDSLHQLEVACLEAAGMSVAP